MWKSLGVVAATILTCSIAYGDEESASTLGELTSGIAAKQAVIDGHKSEECNQNGVGELLTAMIDLDQFARRSLETICPTFEEKCLEQVTPPLQAVDKSNLKRLKLLLARYGWTGLTRCAPHAQNNAWLLVQHADEEPKFQGAILAQMKAAFLAGTADSNDYAYLVDRVATNAHKPQIYGTQGTCQKDGSWKPDPIAAPDGLDERRREMKMWTMKEYFSIVSQMCGKTTPHN